MKSLRLAVVSFVLVLSGCASRQATSLRYLALEQPKGPVHAPVHPPVELRFRRGGVYVLSKNFRPAADVAAYLEQAHQAAGTAVLRRADVRLETPFAIDLFLSGYNLGIDEVRATSD